VETGAICTASPARQFGGQRRGCPFKRKVPPMAGFRELEAGLRAPILGILRAKQPVVSSGHLKYSRFWETAPGDRVRSGLRGGRGSALVVY